MEEKTKMKKPNGYNNAQSYDGSFVRMTAGGHVCEILKATVIDTEYGEQMVLLLDINENSEFDGYYKNDYSRRATKSAEAKWGCTFRQFILDRDGNASPYFKGMIENIEKSNDFTFNWDETKLKGLLVGVVFREEEYEKADGSIGVAVRPYAIRTIEDIIKGVPVPNRRTIERKDNITPAPIPERFSAPKKDFVEVEDDELPF